MKNVKVEYVDPREALDAALTKIAVTLPLGEVYKPGESAFSSEENIQIDAHRLAILASGTAVAMLLVTMQPDLFHTLKNAAVEYVVMRLEELVRDKARANAH